MLKRKLVRAGLFGNGLILMIAAGPRLQPLETSSSTSGYDPVIRQLQAFDSSFSELGELPASALNDLPKIHLNSHATKFVADFTRNNVDALELIRGRGERYFPIMDSIFTYYHLPTELKYLAAVESELKATARSKVGATGPWQLMSTTARDLRLKINSRYDERTDYIRSTTAAALYLRDLYRQFGDWLLVIAAYNSGPGKILSAMKSSHSRNFWSLQGYLPAETRGHVKRFIAIHYYFEQRGSIATLTRAESAAYRNTVTEFLKKQKLAFPAESTQQASLAISR